MTESKNTPNATDSKNTTSGTTPRSLDPKFRDATVPADSDVQPADRTAFAEQEAKRTADKDEETPDQVRARLTSGEVPNDPAEGEIVFRQRVVDSAGNTVEKVHGPMPVGEWAEYSAKHGL